MPKGGLHTGTGQLVGDWSLFRMSRRLSDWPDDCVLSESRFVKSPLSLTRRGTDRRTAASGTPRKWPGSLRAVCQERLAHARDSSPHDRARSWRSSGRVPNGAAGPGYEVRTASTDVLCEHGYTSDPALLRVILKVRDGAGGGYWWVECGTCDCG